VQGVESISVRVGEFRNVDVQSLEFAFDGLKADYIGFGDTRLVVKTIPALAVCQNNEHHYHPRYDNGFRCDVGDCGSGIGLLEEGEELDVIGYTLAQAAPERDSMVNISARS
jgi:Zn finger protein HypA/HybF involved in hydrogenase expression